MLPTQKFTESYLNSRIGARWNAAWSVDSTVMELLEGTIRNSRLVVGRIDEEVAKIEAAPPNAPGLRTDAERAEAKREAVHKLYGRLLDVTRGLPHRVAGEARERLGEFEAAVQAPVDMTAMAADATLRVLVREQPELLESHAHDLALGRAVLSAAPKASGLSPEQYEAFRRRVFKAGYAKLHRRVRELHDATVAVEYALRVARELIQERVGIELVENPAVAELREARRPLGLLLGEVDEQAGRGVRASAASGSCSPPWAGCCIGICSATSRRAATAAPTASRWPAGESRSSAEQSWTGRRRLGGRRLSLRPARPARRWRYEKIAGPGGCWWRWRTWHPVCTPGCRASRPGCASCRWRRSPWSSATPVHDASQLHHPACPAPVGTARRQPQSGCR